MNGPIEPANEWYPASETHWEAGCMERNRAYRVVQPFLDADGDLHDVGEEWIFLGAMFSRYDDELVLGVQLNGQEYRISLLWKPEAQESVVENFTRYVSIQG
jgi:hypothetical protein